MEKEELIIYLKKKIMENLKDLKENLQKLNTLNQDENNEIKLEIQSDIESEYRNNIILKKFLPFMVLYNCKLIENS